MENGSRNPATPGALHRQRDPAAEGEDTAALALVGHLAGGILHEISSPAASLSSNIDTRQRLIEALGATLALEGKPNPKALQALEVLRSLQEVDRLACDRITALLGAWKSTARVAEDPLGPVEIEGVLADAVRLVNAEYRRRIQIELHTAPAVPVWGAAAPLGRAFLNLLVNAAQAIEGEGRIVVEIEDCGPMIEVRITDTGSGMTAAVQQQIFSRGFTTKPVGTGTGLGLLLTRQIIEDQHRGTIRFKSSPGQGTTFFVSLPAARKPHEEP